MLDHSMAFSSFSTNRLVDSYHFYHEVLGLEAELLDDRFLHVHLSSGSPIVIYAKADHEPASYTVLNFQVQGIEALVDDLIKKGVIFLQYPAPIETDSKGISWDDRGSHIAWFKDPGGNILALIEN